MFKTYTTLLYHNFRLPHRLLGVGNFLLPRVLYKEKERRNSAIMYHEKRYYDNPYPDFPDVKECELIDLETNKIDPKFIEKLKATTDKLLEVLDQNETDAMENGSIYTGGGGIAFLYYFLYEKTGDKNYLEKAIDLVEDSLSKAITGDVSFLCGDAGPMAIGAVFFKKLDLPEQSRGCIEKLLEFMPQVLDQESQVPDELLYGRVGYLYSLSFVNKYIPGAIPADYLKKVASSVIISGRHPSNESAPLMYVWDQECYLGGAHGIAGIMYLILQCKEFLTTDEIEMVKPTVDFLLSNRYESGNFPSSIGNKADRLVHWCHGAPGTVQMLCAAYETFGDVNYLTAAEDCGDVVWKRGLLKKGYGICHGVAGNAYTFLILYQLTNDVKHLYRACKFAEWCITEQEDLVRVPDRPFSLFEGLAGTIYFLIDIQDPLEAKFPCFTL